jgi:DNA excision repair protein ERCC-2
MLNKQIKRFKIDDLEIIFPYDYIYPEQYAYMKDLYKSIQKKVKQKNN